MQTATRPQRPTQGTSITYRGCTIKATGGIFLVCGIYPYPTFPDACRAVENSAPDEQAEYDDYHD